MNMGSNDSLNLYRLSALIIILVRNRV